MMKELYVLAYFDAEDNFIEYVRKGRNNAISGYDSIEAARRGRGHSKNSHRATIYNLKILKANGLEEVE